MQPELIFSILSIGVFAALVFYAIRHYTRIMAFRSDRLKENPLYLTTGFSCKYQVTRLNDRLNRWRSSMLALTDQGIRLYTSLDNPDEYTDIPREAMRWYGRPVKYHDKRNELWLHIEQDGEWRLVKLSFWRHPMQEAVRALKLITPLELITAYRRHRPYIHHGPVAAQPAEQDIYGAWTVDEPLSLYVMPLYIVLLRGDRVLRTIPLERIQQIAALRRLDEPEADGLVRFDFDGEKLAFAVRDYESTAMAISEAAKRSLEAPITQKQKKKADEDEDDWE